MVKVPAMDSVERKFVESSVSIAMATYEGEKYLQEQLDSLATQTLLPCELVVTDDGSTDQTLAIVENFARTAPFPVRIYQNEERLGFGDNFIKAASLCTGDIIAFCDQDDRWLEQKIQICVEALKNEKVMLCLHSGILWTGERNFGRKFPDYKVNRIFMPGTTNPLETHPGFSMMFWADLLEIGNNNVRPPDVHNLDNLKKRMPHDKWVWFLASIFGKISIIPDVLCWYRQHDHNTSGAPLEISFRKNFLYSLRAKDYNKIKNLNLECAEILKQISQRHEGDIKRMALTAADVFNSSAHIYNLRSKIYNDKRLPSRVFALLKIIITFGYLKRRGIGLGLRAFLKDIFFGIWGF